MLAGSARVSVADHSNFGVSPHTLIRKQTEYSEEGLDAYEKRYRYPIIRNLQRRAKELSFKIVDVEENRQVAKAVS